MKRLPEHALITAGFLRKQCAEPLELDYSCHNCGTPFQGMVAADFVNGVTCPVCFTEDFQPLRKCTGCTRCNQPLTEMPPLADRKCQSIQVFRNTGAIVFGPDETLWVFKRTASGSEEVAAESKLRKRFISGELDSSALVRSPSQDRFIKAGDCPEFGDVAKPPKTAATKRRRTLTAIAVISLVVAAAIPFGFWQQEQNKIAFEKAAVEAKALAEKQAAEAKALAVKQAAEAKASAEKRLEWTGRAMQRAGFKEETVKRTLTQGGTVVAWGKNDDGQTTVPAGLSGVVAIAAGGWHTVALKQDGTVVAWGYNFYGQTKVPGGLSGVVAIAGGAFHTVALKQDGTVVAWGGNGDGQTKVPAGLSGVVAIAAGGYHTVALKQDGTVVAWGDNSVGQTTLPAGLSGVVAIAAGQYHTVALKQDGTVVAWGFNSDGQTKVPAGLSGVVAIAAGAEHTVALKQDGTVVAWGSNGGGKTTVPAGLSGVVAIAAGYAHTVALKQDGTVAAWGENDKGQTTVPAGLSGVVAIAAGVSHTVALKLD